MIRFFDLDLACHFDDDIQDFSFLASVARSLSIYDGLLVSSLLAGDHWRQYLHINNSQWSHTLPIFSNIITIMLCFSLLVFGFKILMGMFITTFIILFIVDDCLFQMDVITKLNYFQTQFLMSIFVIMSLIISGIIS